MELSRNRNYAIDNLRAFLMICVVAGHLLEILSFSFSRHLYVTIYSFHMPAFAFLSGMCCKLDENTPKRLTQTYVYPYLVFQTLYLLFSNSILDISVSFQYTTPYWLLWYLMAMFWWHGMLSMYLALRSKPLALVISMLVALASGFDASIGYYASLSRTLVLFPFFLGGYYSKNIPFFSDPEWYTKQKKDPSWNPAGNRNSRGHPSGKFDLLLCSADQ